MYGFRSSITRRRFGICSTCVTAVSKIRALTCYYWLREIECYVFDYPAMVWWCSCQVSWNSIVWFENLDGKLANHAGRMAISVTSVWRKWSGLIKLPIPYLSVGSWYSRFICVCCGAVVSVAVERIPGSNSSSGTLRADLKWKLLCKKFSGRGMAWQKFHVACPAYLASLQRNAAPLCSHSISATTSTSFVQPRDVFPCCRDVSVLLVPWFLTSLYLSISITQFYSFSEDLFLSSLSHFSSYSFVNLQGFVVQLLAVLLS